MCSSNSYGYGDNGESLSLHRDIIFWRPQRDRFEVLPLMLLKEPTLWWLTPSTTWLWLEMLTQSFPSFFKVWCIDRLTVAGFLSVFQVTFPNTDGILVNGICWQVSSKIARFPSAGPLFRSVVDSSYWCLTGIFSCLQWFALMYERWNWWLNHIPSDWYMSWNECSRLSFPISRGDVLENGFWWKSRTSVDVADGSNRFSLAGLSVEKKVDEGTTPQSRSISFSEYGIKKFFDCEFFDRFFHASFSLLQFSVCFCRRFQWEKSDFGCKNVIFGIFEFFSWYERERSRY